MPWKKDNKEYAYGWTGYDKISWKEYIVLKLKRTKGVTR